MKKIFILVLLTSLVYFFAGCRKSDKEINGKPTIAFVMKTLNNPYFIEMQKGAEEAAKRLGVNLVVQAADREVDVEKQMQIIENLIQRKVSALCITPSGSKEIVPAIVKANEAGIPVLIVDTRIDKQTLTEAQAKIVTFIGSDNIDGGRIAGKFIVDKLGGKGNIVVLEGIPGHETGDARLKGFYEVIKDNKEIKVIATQTANWERDQGYVVFQNILQAHPDVEAVFACNDMMALGAVEAISAAKKKHKIIVVGFDAIQDSRDAIMNDQMNGSIAQHPEEMGRLSVENAFKVIKGEKIPTEIPVRIELITKDRLQK
ncbi:MAG: sugar ABC transporter substrate-binding protein [Ignavibacteriales bacterium]|nr:sugar ABC transporter substrate-binding protein [Ignavibacteriales bacterium]